jgi:hypothetical protein
VGDAGGDLDDGGPGQELEDELPGGRPAVDIEDAAGGTAAGRIGEDRTEAGQVECRRVRDADGPREPERGEVGAGDLDAERVEIDARRGEACARECDQVTADAAAQVDDAGGLGGCQSCGPVSGDPWAGGLLECFADEVHRGRVRSELGDGAVPQLHLAQRHGGPCGVRLHLAEGGRCTDRIAGVVGVQVCGPRQQLLAGLGEQPAEGIQIHVRRVANNKDNKDNGRRQVVLEQELSGIGIT